MRLPDSGRSCHPKLRASSKRFYCLDEAGVQDGRCLATGSTVTNLSPGSKPFTIQGCTPRARRFLSTRTDSLEETASDATLIADLLEDWTIGILWRPTSFPFVDSVLVAHSGIDTDASANTNFLVLIRMLVGGGIRCIWEHSVGTNVTTTFANYVPTPYSWSYLAVRKSNTTAVGPGGTCILELLVNGVVVDSAAGVVNASGGSTGHFRIGHYPDAAGAATNNGNVDIAGVYVWNEALTDAQVEDDARRIRLMPFFTRVDSSIVVLDELGAPRELTDMDGVDFVDSITINDEEDQPCMTGTIKLAREQENASLAGLRSDAKANLTDVYDPESYFPLLREDAAIEVFTGRVPVGLRATQTDLVSTLKGYIDEVDDGGEAIVLTVRDEGGRLIDAYCEEEVDYSDDIGSAVEGEMQFILDDNDNDSGNNSVAGLSSRDGSYDPITLYVPTSPNWELLAWRQRREPILPALRSLAAQVAWEVRYVYDQNPDVKAWRLTFFEPDRDRIDPDLVVATDDVLEVKGLKRSTFGKRLVVRVVYPSSESADPAATLAALVAPYADYSARSGWSSVDGEENRLNAFVEVQNDTALALPGAKRQFMEISEPSSTQIDTVTEAFRMAFGALRDLEETDLAKSIDMPLCFEMERGDMLRFRPRRGLFTAPQTMAVKRISHVLADQAVTSLEVRGKPSVGFKRWLRLEARPGQGRPGIMDPSDALTDVVPGTMLQLYRNILDRSAYLTGGRFIQIRNPEFSSFSAGVRAPPDGWRVTAGAWNTDLQMEAGVQLSGGKAIRVVTVDGALSTDFIPITGAANTPYSVECTWQRVSGDDLVQIEIDFYDADKVVIGGATKTLYPGAAVTASIRVDNFAAVAAGTGTFYKSKAEGIVPPSSGDARYVRIAIMGRQVGGAFGPIIVDDVFLLRNTRKGRTSVVDTGLLAGWVGFVSAAGPGESVNVPFVNPEYAQGFSDDEYDVAENFTRAPTPELGGGVYVGGHWRCVEAGVFRIHARVFFDVSATWDVADFASVDIVKNDTYDSVAISGAVGTVVASKRFRPTDLMVIGSTVGSIEVFAEIQAKAGDYIQVNIRSESDTAGEEISWVAGDTVAGTIVPTAMSVVLLSNE